MVPNITPDAETGIGDWSPYELGEYLASGMDPDGDFAGGPMAEVIDDGIQFLDPEDNATIVEYLRSLTPIHHRVESERDDSDEDLF